MERLDHFRQRALERENRIWDERRGFDTRGWVVPNQHSTVSGLADGFPYAGTHVRLARALLRAVRDRAAGATFVDLGSGKARVVLLAAELPFGELVGVEYDEQLHRTAEQNVTRLGAGDAPPIRLELADVRDFSFPETPLVIYMNNPFPEQVLKIVLANLSASHAARPRPITFVYQQLRNEHAEHDTRNAALLAELDFMGFQRVAIRGLANRFLLRPYVLHGVASLDEPGSIAA